MLIWTTSDVVAACFFGLCVGALVVLWIAALIHSAYLRIRNSFRKLWNRKHG